MAASVIFEPGERLEWADGLPAIPDSDVDFTVEVWFKPTGGGDVAMIAKSALLFGDGWHLEAFSADRDIEIWADDVNHASVGDLYTDNAWRYTAFVHDASANTYQSYYADDGGALQVGGNGSGAGPTTNAERFAVGSLGGGDISIAFVRVWSEALSQSELEAVFDKHIVGTAAANGLTGLEFNWDADEDPGAGVDEADFADQESGENPVQVHDTPARSGDSPTLGTYTAGLGPGVAFTGVIRMFRGHFDFFDDDFPQVADNVTTITPSPVEIPFIVPVPTLTITLAPDPVAVDFDVVGPTVAGELTPAPVAVDFDVAGPTLTITLTPSPVAVDFDVAGPTVAAELTPAPGVIDFDVVGPTLTVTLTPDPVVVDFDPVPPTLTVTLLPDPVAIDFDVPDPFVAQAATPAPVVIDFDVPAPTLTIELTPSPVAIPFVVPDPNVVITDEEEPEEERPEIIVVLGWQPTRKPQETPLPRPRFTLRRRCRLAARAGAVMGMRVKVVTHCGVRARGGTYGGCKSAQPSQMALHSRARTIASGRLYELTSRDVALESVFARDVDWSVPLSVADGGILRTKDVEPVLSWETEELNILGIPT